MVKVEVMLKDRNGMDDIRRFGPKSDDHYSVGEPCPLCEVAFKAGDFTTLLPLKPASDEDLVKMLDGRAYTSEAKEVHWECGQKFVESKG